MGEKGYVYVLTNPSFRDDWVKIGKSKRLPDVRGRLWVKKVDKIKINKRT